MLETNGESHPTQLNGGLVSVLTEVVTWRVIFSTTAHGAHGRVGAGGWVELQSYLMVYTCGRSIAAAVKHPEVR